MPSIENLAFTDSFSQLGDAFYTRLRPTPMAAPYLVCASDSAGELIGLDSSAYASDAFLQIFSGNHVPTSTQPLSAVYSGHQFGVWAGQLGDGRAILLGEVSAPSLPLPSTMELQLKGAGMTPYSRMGDGRAVLRSSIREFLCSEAMAALGIPTTRALCVTGSDLPVLRETRETAAVATRMSPSFVRFGSFEHWFYQEREHELKKLADYVIERFYPTLQGAKNRYRDLLEEVTRRTAHLVAQWQAVGFMHGVMNTDNMSILGLTLDYGPFGFMEAFDARHICNHSDHQGRYAYQAQPAIAQWNCYALGQALLPLIGSIDDAHAALEVFQPEFTAQYDALLHAKLGLSSTEPEDTELITSMFSIMQSSHVDFTLFFRRLGDLQVAQIKHDEPIRDLFIDRAAFDAWALQYRQRLKKEKRSDADRRHTMHSVNPKYILRNYLAQTAIEKAQNKDFSEIRKLLSILENPFDEQAENETYAALPPDWANELEVSCSS